jgi:hypothetical protein
MIIEPLRGPLCFVTPLSEDEFQKASAFYRPLFAIAQREIDTARCDMSTCRQENY